MRRIRHPLLETSIVLLCANGAWGLLLGFILAHSLLPVTASAQGRVVLAEHTFSGAVGRQVGRALAAHADYRQERELWRTKIADAEAWSERCGGCAEAQSELAKWRNIEGQFQEVAGAAAQASGMPPLVRQWLGIEGTPFTPISDSEWRQAANLGRPSWFNERPEICHEPVDQYIACQRGVRSLSRSRGDWRLADVVGGQCYEPWKLYYSCAQEDYRSLALQKQLAAARSAGAIVPEIRDDGMQDSAGVTVYYGEVPDNFIPEVPPASVIEQTLADMGKGQQLVYLFQKRGIGHLFQVEVEYFRHRNVVRSNCQTVRGVRSELERRGCEDLMDLTYESDSLMLTCWYTREGSLHERGSKPFRAWYRERPERADPGYLLERLHGHPLLLLNDGREACPATWTEAERVEAQYQNSLTALRADIAQVPLTTVLPTPDGIAARKAARQEQFEEMSREGEDERQADELEAARVSGVCPPSMTDDQCRSMLGL